MNTDINSANLLRTVIGIVAMVRVPFTTLLSAQIAECVAYHFVNHMPFTTLLSAQRAEYSEW